MAEIHRASFPPAEVWGVDAFALQLDLPGVFALLDEDGGLLLARVTVDEAEVLTLAVQPAARRHGLGRRLLEAAMATAWGQGARTMFLEVSAINSAARNLYETTGFRQVGLRRRYYPDGSDALVMRRAITSGAPASA